MASADYIVYQQLNADRRSNEHEVFDRVQANVRGQHGRPLTCADTTSTAMIKTVISMVKFDLKTRGITLFEDDVNESVQRQISQAS
jgi:hypothetical protein